MVAMYNSETIQRVWRERRENAAKIVKQPAEPPKVVRPTVSLHMPEWAKQIVKETTEKHGVTPAAIMSKSRLRKIVKCRNEIQYLMRSHPSTPSFPLIGRWLGRDHTSALWAVACHARDAGVPELTNYDCENVRRSNANRRARERAEERRARKEAA